MELSPLKARPLLLEKESMGKQYLKFTKYLDALNRKKLPKTFVKEVNQQLKELNATHEKDKAFVKQFKLTRKQITDRAAKELQLVPKHYYRTLGVAIGMTAFGLPLGIAVAFALQNAAFIGIGLPIGLAMGLGVGKGLDKKAKEEGRQLAIDITSL